MELLDKAQRWADHDLDPATASSLHRGCARGGDEEAQRVGASHERPLSSAPRGLRALWSRYPVHEPAVVIRATATCARSLADTPPAPWLSAATPATAPPSLPRPPAVSPRQQACASSRCPSQPDPAHLSSRCATLARTRASSGHGLAQPRTRQRLQGLPGWHVVTGRDGQGVQIVLALRCRDVAAITPPADQVPMNDIWSRLVEGAT